MWLSTKNLKNTSLHSRREYYLESSWIGRLDRAHTSSLFVRKQHRGGLRCFWVRSITWSLGWWVYSIGENIVKQSRESHVEWAYQGWFFLPWAKGQETPRKIVNTITLETRVVESKLTASSMRSSSSSSSDSSSAIDVHKTAIEVRSRASSSSSSSYVEVRPVASRHSSLNLDKYHASWNIFLIIQSTTKFF